MREPENPIHEHAVAGSFWTRVNYEEAMPGIPTPLSWSIWKAGMNDGSADAFRQLGFYPRGEQPGSTGMFYGRMSGRIDQQCRALAGMPGFDPETYAEHMYAVPRGELGVTKSRRRLPIIAAKAPVAILTAPRTLRRVGDDAERWWRTTVNSPIDAGQTLTIMQEGAALFRRVLQVHSVTCTTVIPATYQAVMKLGEKVGRPELAMRVTSGGKVEEAGMLGAVWDVAQGRISLTDFLSDFGFYGPNPGEISVPSWREDPSPINDMIAGYKSNGTDPRQRLERQSGDQAEAERELLSLLSGRRERRSASIAIRLARTWVPYREVAKAAFLKAIDGARAAARVLGDDLAQRGVIEQSSDVCYFTIDELVAGLGSDAATTAKERRANEDRYRALQLPSFWRGDPEPVVEDSEPVGDSIDGIPASGGVAEGRARVVLDPGHCHVPIDVDEILVTRTTDPSWAAMFMSAAGLVVDIGTPLSHAAIIARELGIPCVIGTKNGTKLIADGAMIRVDGSSGKVEVVS